RPNEELAQTLSELPQPEPHEAAPTETDPAANPPDVQKAAEDAAPALGTATSTEGVRDESFIDDDGVQTMFEDLGAGPGLTAYAIDQVPMAILIHAGDRL